VVNARIVKDREKTPPVLPESKAFPSDDLLLGAYTHLHNVTQPILHDQAI
jgi:hypothetical protein